MRVFITGATGYLGEAVVRELRHSHDLVGLTRSEEGAERLRAEGVTPLVGDLRDPDGWRAEAARAEAVIHLGLDEDARAASDRAALDGLIGAARKGSPRLLVYTSSCWVLGNTGDEPATEEASLDHPAEAAVFRVEHERRALTAGNAGLTTAVIRPAMAYGGAGGLVAGFFRSAEEKGAAEYVGDGTNRWPVVHRDDVARLYHLVLERAAGGIYHASEDSPVRVADIARMASQAAGYGGTTRSIPLAEARERLGAKADALVLDQVMAAPRAHELGWRPRHAPFRNSAHEVWREALAGP